MMKKFKMMKVSEDFEEFVHKIANEKISNGTADRRKVDTHSARRITLAITRHINAENLMNDIIKAEWEGDQPSPRKWN